jgi:hypothetical protein
VDVVRRTGRGHRGGPAVRRGVRPVGPAWQGGGARRGAKPKVSRGAGRWEGARRPWEGAREGTNAEAAGAAWARRTRGRHGRGTLWLQRFSVPLFDSVFLKISQLKYTK